ncbi:MAG: hypothetical protein R3D05_03375 [Dongiaceae bacterium]
MALSDINAGVTLNSIEQLLKAGRRMRKRLAPFGSAAHERAAPPEASSSSSELCGRFRRLGLPLPAIRSVHARV